jgi:hypothetical protein
VLGARLGMGGRLVAGGVRRSGGRVRGWVWVAGWWRAVGFLDSRACLGVRDRTVVAGGVGVGRVVAPRARLAVRSVAFLFGS